MKRLLSTVSLISLTFILGFLSASQRKSAPLSFEPPPLACPQANPDASYTIPSLFLEDLTWTEIHEALCRGYRSVLIPTGGTEQNGPHMILGKHNYIVRHSAAEIAGQIGNILAAPVLAYVPEGRIHPPEGHMRFSGTLSVSEDIYQNMLEDTARSLIQHGFRNIFFLGDSFNNQRPQEKAAARLNRQFSRYGVHVLNVAAYYDSKDEAVRWLESQGESRDSIGTHAGIRDTSELFFVHPEGIRKDQLANRPAPSNDPMDVNGNPARASKGYGRKILEIRIGAAVRQIREALD